MFLPHPRVKVSIVGSLCDREVACSASDRQGSNFESCVWRTVSSHLSHHPQEVLLAQFSLYVHKGGLKLDSFHFYSLWGQNGEHHEGSEVNAIALPFRYRIRNSSAGDLTPSTLPLGHGNSHNAESLRVSVEETFCFFETWTSERERTRNLRLSKQVDLTTVLEFPHSRSNINGKIKGMERPWDGRALA